MSHIDDSIRVSVPVRTAYNQWTQFEDFPRFMTGVQEVQQVDDAHLHWRAEIMGKDLEWDSEIVEQVPDQRIAWRSIGGLRNAGVVEFRALSPTETEVHLALDYEPEGVLENLGSATGVASHRVHNELENFKEFVEQRGSETGAWRGQIRDGEPMEAGLGSRLGNPPRTNAAGDVGSGSVGGEGFSEDIDTRADNYAHGNARGKLPGDELP